MVDDQSLALRVLIIEDLEVDAERALYHLKRAGITCVWRRVETEPALVAALHDFLPTIILSDFALPQYDGMAALRVSREHAPDIPFLFLSGTIGEERAIDALLSGAVDYVLKENMARLGPAVRRALSEAAAKAERLRQQAQIARLNRVLRMLSGVNGLVLRIRDRTELLRETCRLAVSEGGYAAAIASAIVPGVESMHPVAWSGMDDRITGNLRSYVAKAAARKSSVVGQVISTGKPFVCNNTANLSATAAFDAMMVQAGLLSVVALPLVVDNTVIALLTLTARDSDVVGDEEMEMLREVAGNLSFGLQFMQRDKTASFLSHFDPQTGLAKRPLFCERLQRMISDPTSAQMRYAVVVLDVERLSIINDSFGRRTGDLLLQHVADRLKRCYLQTEQIAHFGGGTFALIGPMRDLTESEFSAAGQKETDIVFGEPFLIEGRSIPVAVRVGFAVLPGDGPDAMALVQNAEAALRNARAAGETHMRYSAATRSVGVDRLALEHRLRLALDRGEFELYYQPKVNVISRRVRGAEALIRWRSPEDGLVSPGVFLPLLEATGLIIPVSDWVVNQAARDCQKWLNAGLPPVRVAVNIAPAQLRHPDFVAKFLQAVNPWSTKDCGLDVEITEGVLQEESVAEVGKLKALRDTGIKIAIDDFGTGYSSLSRLSSLPIDTLKIDRCFISQAPGSASGSSLVRTIIALAREFSMTTVAEGVEKQEELDVLLRMGCDQSQGYLHSPAVTADEFALLLQHGKNALLQSAEFERDRAPLANIG